MRVLKGKKVQRYIRNYLTAWGFDADATQLGVTVSQDLWSPGASQPAPLLAVLKGTRSEVETAKKKYVNGSVWELSNVKFEDRTQSAFVSSPLKVSVDLKKSTLNRNEDADLDKQLVQWPVPPRTVAETSQITTTRHQDLLALVTKVAPLRQTRRGEV